MSRRVLEDSYREQLFKVIRSTTFRRADQLRQLLQWLGERSLTENPIPPTEKEIAELVLHRTGFDPQFDSLVRKEVGRLREKLTKYYTVEGTRDPIRITLSGGYLLAFAELEVRPPRKLGEIEGEPCWLILPFRAQQMHADYSSWLMEELLVKLGETGGPQLLSPTTSLGYVGRSGDVRYLAAECGADFVIEGSVRLHGDEIEALVWLVNGQNGRSRSSRRLRGTDVREVARLAAEWLLEQDLSE